MPTYEYECKKCGNRFDVFQRMTDAPLTTCPAGLCEEEEWGRGDVKRLLSGGAGLIFKGSGFYITDYARKSSTAAGSNGQSGKAAPEPTPADGNSNSSQSESKADTATNKHKKT